MIEIKLDKTTLPKNGQLCEFETHTHKEIVGFYDEEENMFYLVNDDPKPSIMAWDVHFWKELEIEWEKHECLEPKENGYRLFGCDKFKNYYEASGTYSLGELEKVEDIEHVAVIKRPEVAKNIIWRSNNPNSFAKTEAGRQN